MGDIESAGSRTPTHSEMRERTERRNRLFGGNRFIDDMAEAADDEQDEENEASDANSDGNLIDFIDDEDDIEAD